MARWPVLELSPGVVESRASTGVTHIAAGGGVSCDEALTTDRSYAASS